MKTDGIAVFDVGKTNKKVLIYGNDLTVLTRRVQRFDTEIIDGVELEPIEAIQAWFLRTLQELAQEYAISAVAITTHGAALVAIGEDGAPACPVVSYTHQPADETLHERFYATVGRREELQERTATVELLPLINPAKLLYFCRQQWPERYARIQHILFLPQYFAYLLTGAITVDNTYAGCHSYLWNYKTWSWDPQVVAALGLSGKLPGEPQPSWHVAGSVAATVSEQTGLGTDIPVTVGIHDSNASLLPHLLKRRGQEFVLNSTGTWCVAMHAVPTEEGQRREISFHQDEIGKSVFFNISAFGDPVKTTILVGGLEYETYTTILSALHQTDTMPSFNRQLYERIIRRADQFIIPGVLPGTGQFPHSRPRIIDGHQEYELADIQSHAVIPPLFQDLPAAYAVLNLSIALQSRVALKRVGLREGMELYTEGGFRHNEHYNKLLAAFFPESPVFLTNIDEATSLGAAITGLAARDGASPQEYADRFTIERFRVEQEPFGELHRYEVEFLKQV